MDRRNGGYSLIELLIAIAIAALIMASVGGALVIASRHYGHNTEETELQNEAQTVMTQIENLIIDNKEDVHYSYNEGSGDTAAMSDPAGLVAESKKLVLKSGDVENTIEWTANNRTLYYSRVKEGGDVETEPLSGIVSDFSCDLTHINDRRMIYISADFQKNDRLYHADNNITLRNKGVSTDTVSGSGSTIASMGIELISPIVVEPGEVVTLNQARVKYKKGVGDTTVNYEVVGDGGKTPAGTYVANFNTLVVSPLEYEGKIAIRAYAKADKSKELQFGAYVCRNHWTAESTPENGVGDFNHKETDGITIKRIVNEGGVDQEYVVNGPILAKPGQSLGKFVPKVAYTIPIEGSEMDNLRDAYNREKAQLSQTLIMEYLSGSDKIDYNEGEIRIKDEAGPGTVSFRYKVPHSLPNNYASSTGTTIETGGLRSYTIASAGTNYNRDNNPAWDTGGAYPVAQGVYKTVSINIVSSADYEKYISDDEFITGSLIRTGGASAGTIALPTVDTSTFPAGSKCYTFYRPYATRSAINRTTESWKLNNETGSDDYYSGYTKWNGKTLSEVGVDGWIRLEGEGADWTEKTVTMPGTVTKDLDLWTDYAIEIIHVGADSSGKIHYVSKRCFVTVYGLTFTINGGDSATYDYGTRIPTSGSISLTQDHQAFDKSYGVDFSFEVWHTSKTGDSAGIDDAKKSSSIDDKYYDKTEDESGNFNFHFKDLIEEDNGLNYATILKEDKGTYFIRPILKKDRDMPSEYKKHYIKLNGTDAYQKRKTSSMNIVLYGVSTNVASPEDSSSFKAFFGLGDTDLTHYYGGWYTPKQGLKNIDDAGNYEFQIRKGNPDKYEDDSTYILVRVKEGDKYVYLGQYVWHKKDDYWYPANNIKIVSDNKALDAYVPASALDDITGQPKEMVMGGLAKVSLSNNSADSPYIIPTVANNDSDYFTIFCNNGEVIKKVKYKLWYEGDDMCMQILTYEYGDSPIQFSGTYKCAPKSREWVKSK